MRTLRSLSIAAVALVCLGAASACTTTALDNSVATATASNRFNDICRLAPAAHATFVVLAANVTVKPAILTAEAAAYTVVRTTCANPPTDVASAVVTLAEAYAKVVALQADVAAVQGKAI